MGKFAKIIMAVCLVILMAVPAMAGTTELVSISSDGVQGNGWSLQSKISADGRFILFYSTSGNLVPNDTNGTGDMFVRDLETGTTERVSISSDGNQGNGSSSEASISSDGRFIAFASSASNLVPNDFNNVADIFIRDRVLGTTELVSISSDGVQGNNQSRKSSISADGRFIAFSSWAQNLVPIATNGFMDVYVHDRIDKTTELINKTSDGVAGNGGSANAKISPDGSLVTFITSSSNLVPGYPNVNGNLLVHDRNTGTTELLSVSTSGEMGNNHTHIQTSTSADGRFIVFSSRSDNLVPGDTNGTYDIFIRDRQLGTTELISKTELGVQGNGSSRAPWINMDGTHVAHYSHANNLIAGDTNNTADIIMYDLLEGTNEIVSISSSGILSNGYSAYPSLSADAQIISFESNASNLVPNDINGTWDIFVHTRGPSNSPPVANSGADQTVECGSSVTLDGSGSTDPDGDTISYSWSGSFGSAAGETPTVALPLGTHTITLTVDDGNGETSTDEMVVTVADTTAPSASATLSGTLLSNGWYQGDVLVEISATDTCSGVARITYTLDGAQTVASGGYASETVTATGTHSVLYSATDNEGNTSAEASLSMELFTADSDGLTALISNLVAGGLIAPQIENSLVKQAGNGSYNALANHIQAQTGKKIDPEAAALLLEAIRNITGN